MKYIALIMICFCFSCKDEPRNLSSKLLGTWKHEKKDVVLSFNEEFEVEEIVFGSVINATYSVSEDSTLSMGTSKHKILLINENRLELLRINNIEDPRSIKKRKEVYFKINDSEFTQEY